MEVTTTTTSVLARRAAKYLSKYCAEHKGCVNCAFANRSNSTCEINIAKFPSLWKFTPLWSDADVALAKAMMPYAKIIFWPIESNPNPNHRYFKGDGQRTIPLPTGAFKALSPGEVGKTMTAKHRRWNERLHDEKLWEVDNHED